MVMRNAFIKDSLRKVKGSLSRFIAIAAITGLGVAFFAGIRATAPDMRATAQSYLNGLHFMNIHLVGTAGFTGDDMQALKTVKGVSGVMPSYSADALLMHEDSNLTVKLLSLAPDTSAGTGGDINRPKLTQGRMPAKEDECLADPRLINLYKFSLGDEVTFVSGDGGGIGQTLRRATFKIVGVAENPLYISYERGSASIGSGVVDCYFLLPFSAFNLPVYTDIYLTVANPDGLSYFDDGFADLIKPVADRLEKLGAERSDIRYAQLKNEAEAKLAKAQAELDANRKKLSDAKSRIDAGEAELQAGEKALAKAREDFNRQISQAKAKLEASQAEYEARLKQYQDGKKAFDRNAAALEQQKATLGVGGKSAAEIQAMIAQLQAAYDPNQQKAGMLAALQALLPQQQAIEQAKAGLDQTQAALSHAQAQLEKGRAQLEAQRSEGQSALEKQQRALNDTSAQLDKARAEYEKQAAQARPALEQAQAQIDEGRAQLANLKKPVWYVLDQETNAGFISYKQDADRIAAIGMVFPLIFFLVAALVSLTTMTRLVEDDRIYIGTMKALGYGRGAVASKYLLYAVAASLIGSAAGLAAGFNIFPRVIFDAYRILYTLPPVKAEFNVKYALISTAAAVACAALPAFAVCLSSLREAPASLMRPKAPGAGRRIFLERLGPIWKRMNFSQKVAARNLFRYKKRMLMTLAGVAGCTALIFTGFGLRDSISTIVGKQYEEINTYDMVLRLTDNATDGEISDLVETLSGDATGLLKTRQQSVDVLKGDKVKTAYLVVPLQTDALPGFINLRERIGHKALAPDDKTVVVTEKLASLMGLKKGGKIEFRASDGTVKEAVVGGICENYLFHYIFMSPEMYASLYGHDPVPNQILGRLRSHDATFEDAISGKLIKQPGVSSVSFTTGLKDNFRKMIRALRYVVLVLIFSAAALNFVVLFSLTSINIAERQRELATIKVLGFYDSELAAYTYRENAVLTLLGTALGLILGIYMERFVITTAEVDLVMFSRDLLWPSYVYSALLTFVFAAFVNLIMLPHLKKIDMVSSLKSAE